MVKCNFTAALIEPSVIAELQYDFAGINSVTLPALYDLLARKNVTILDCKLLHSKIRGEIGQSALVSEFQQMRSFCDGFDLSCLSQEDLNCAVATLKGVDLQCELADRFEKQYANAIGMPSCNTDEVLGAYYAKVFPFKNMEEDFTVADALILSTFIDYANSHPDDKFLVVTHSIDWGYILDNLANVTVVRSAELVMEMWLPKGSVARQLFKRFQQRITEKMQSMVQNRRYVVGNDNVDAQPDIWLEHAEIYNWRMTPLQITDNKAYYMVDTDVDVVGSYKRTYCMFEDERWTEIGDGNASVVFEVEISFDNGDIANTATVSCVKVVERGAIPVSIDCYD